MLCPMMHRPRLTGYLSLLRRSLTSNGLRMNLGDLHRTRQCSQRHTHISYTNIMVILMEQDRWVPTHCPFHNPWLFQACISRLLSGFFRPYLKLQKAAVAVPLMGTAHCSGCLFFWSSISPKNVPLNRKPICMAACYPENKCLLFWGAVS